MFVPSANTISSSRLRSSSPVICSRVAIEWKSVWKSVSQSASVNRSSRLTTPHRRITSCFSASRCGALGCFLRAGTVIHTWPRLTPIRTPPVVSSFNPFASRVSAVSTLAFVASMNSVGSCGSRIAE